MGLLFWCPTLHLFTTNYKDLFTLFLVLELSCRLLLNFKFFFNLKFLSSTCKRSKFFWLTLYTHHLNDEKDLQFLKTQITEGIPNCFARFFFPPCLTSSTSLTLMFNFTENCSDLLFPLLSTSRDKNSTNLAHILLVIFGKS